MSASISERRNLNKDFLRPFQIRRTGSRPVAAAANTVDGWTRKSAATSCAVKSSILGSASFLITSVL
jgi:hypothetical protein